MAVNENNLALFLVAPGQMEIRKTKIPEPAKGEVQLAMQSVGICGSDVTIWKNGGIENYLMTAPFVQGHEGSAVVAAIGEGVTSFDVGDKVMIHPCMPCERCEFCLNGPNQLCTNLTFCSLPPTCGFLQRHFCHPAKLCHKLPDNVSPDEGALVETLSVAVRACEHTGAKANDAVLICGAGPIGLCVMLVMKARGVSKICITDVLQYRVEFAKSLGATHAVLVDRSQGAKEVAASLCETLGTAPTVTLDCTGDQQGIEYGFLATKAQGILVFVGIPSTKTSLSVLHACLHEIRMSGTFAYTPENIDTAIHLVSSGKVDVKPLIRNRFPLEQGFDAFKTVVNKSDGVIKAIIYCNKGDLQ